MDQPRIIAENKLILLYIFKRLQIPLTNLQLTKVTMENGFMNYFEMQSYFNELLEAKYIEAFVLNEDKHYRLTKQGNSVLDAFLPIIPFGIKSIIDKLSQETKKDLITENSVSADFSIKSENEFLVRCRISEGDFILMELKLTTGSMDDAKAICEKWKNKSQDVYMRIINLLTE